MQLSERIGRRLKLRDLNIFLVVATERSMSKAAARLAVSQPAISKAIADMEYVLGAPLLDRGPRGVEPTLYGRALIKRSIAIFDELRHSVTDIESLLDPSVGEARIGSTGPLAAAIVPAVIDRLTNRYPGISIDVVDAFFDVLVRELHDRSIDLAIGRATAPITDEGLDTEVLFSDRLLVVAGLRSKWANRRKVKFEELAGEPWTIPPHIGRALRAAGLPTPRVVVPSTSVSVGVHLAASGRFLAVFPQSMLRFGAKGLALKALPIKLPVQPTAVLAVTLKKRTLNPVARLFLETVRAMTRTLASSR
jgi:DNA-binding transcriptional LysR family regulator